MSWKCDTLSTGTAHPFSRQSKDRISTYVWLYGLCQKCTTGLALMSTCTFRNVKSEQDALLVTKIWFDIGEESLYPKALCPRNLQSKATILTTMYHSYCAVIIQIHTNYSTDYNGFEHVKHACHFSTETLTQMTDVLGAQFHQVQCAMYTIKKKNKGWSLRSPSHPRWAGMDPCAAGS